MVVARVLRYMQRGKTLVVLAVLAPALLTLALGSLALLRPAVPTVAAQPTLALTATPTIAYSPTPTPRATATAHATRNTKPGRQRGGGRGMR